MAEEWIVRVQGKEYGPVDLETLREWKTEGRVLPANEVRREDVDVWSSAAEIPGLFESSTPEVGIERYAAADTATSAPRSLGKVLADTWRIYRAGFWQFLYLSALVAVPSICAQISSAALGSPTNVEIDWRTALAAMFNLSMLILSLAAWPLYIGGIQILTAELAAGRKVQVVDLAQRALKFWKRVLLLCVIVYGSYVFWTVMLFLVIAIVLAFPPVFALFFALLALALWIWLIGRLWVNFLFWQQFAVLDNADFSTALRQSKELARSRTDLPRFKRPLWQGAFVVSLWFLVVLALNAGQIWSAVALYFQELSKATDLQALLQSMNEHAKAIGFNGLTFGLWLVQRILQPLLGIAFVLLFFDYCTRKD